MVTGKLQALAHGIILSWGLRRAVVAMAAGAVGALSMPPFGFFPALIVSLVVVVWLIDGAGGAGAGKRLGPLRAAAVSGWFWGFGYSLAGLWWLGAAFLVEADRFAWAMPLGVIGLPAALAFFYAFGFVAARLVWSASPWRILALAFGLGLAEWLRGHLFTGFPWNSLGMALGQQLWPMQIAALIGLWGMTVLAVAIAAAPATIATAARPAGRWIPTCAALVAAIAVIGYGAMRIPADPSPLVAGVQLRIMQPDLPQDEKFNPANREDIMQLYLRLSDRATSPQTAGVADVTHLIWPESAFPFLLHNDPRALAQIAALLPSDVTLITGAARAEQRLRAEGHDFFNSIHVVAGDGSIRNTYDKVHLVPFGEYLPAIFDGALRALGLREFIQVPGGFTAATRRRILEAPGLPPIAASICYEAIFPGTMRPDDESGSRATGMMLNVTNDAWFGDTPGPRQHFAQARLRSVEEGLPLVRAANSGISAVVDPYGRILASLDMNIEGVLDSGLPESREPTVFVRIGNGIFWLQLLLCLLASLTARRVAGS